MSDLTLEEKYKSNDVQYELGRNFIEYAVAVNSDRSIPDAKSGLKPVAKRILWSAYEEGRTFNKPHVKSARIVGDVMGKYHPHGDSSIYGAMVRLSQPWVLRYPLIDWHGSNGNIAGDGPAAARYTEARLSKLAEDGMLQGIKKKNVNFIDNYDETLDEPVTLPAIFPNLLCNPNTGIGVAMACNWLPHNLGEVANAIFDFMDGKEPMLPGPDFPTGGIVINQKDIPAIMKTGHGSVKVRGKYKVEKSNIIFYEIPYGTTIEGLLSEISAVCDAKEVEGISEIRDESNKKGIRIVIECNKGANPDAIANKLYSKTNLQTSISYNQVGLLDKTPVELTLADCCKIYVDHNIDCLIKEWNFDLEKAKARLHIVEGLLICLEDIDNVIALIKKSESSATAKTALMEKYNLSEEQAKSVLAMRLSSLAHMEKIELENEKKELIDFINDLNYALSTPARQKAEVKDRLSNIVKKYGDARRTELTHIELKPEEKEIAEVIPEDVVVVATQSGLIKKVPTASFKVQKKGGKGVKSDDDIILDVIKTNTVDTIMFFTNKGKMYRTVADNIPNGTNTTKGVMISSLVKLDNDERVMAISSLHRKSTPQYIIFVTKNGMIKKSYLEEYTKTNRNTGIAALNVKDGDEVVDIIFQDDEDMVLVTKNGMSIKFATKDVAPIGRVAMGVKGIKLAEGDEVIAALPIHKITDQIAIFTDGGLGKKVDINELPMQARGGKGTIIYKPTEQTGNVVGSAMVSDEDLILLSGNKTSICFSAKDIPSLGKTGIGNIMIKNNRVLSVTKI